MKKIIILILFVSLACSDSEDNSNGLMMNKIVGDWKLVGYYDDEEDPVTGLNYHTVENGFETTFRQNKTFETTFKPSGTYSGKFNIANDSILTFNYATTPSGISNPERFKIIVLNDNVLEYVAPGAIFGPQLRLERINNP